MQWPGSHVHYKNETLKYLQDYNESLTWNQRIDMIIEWLQNPIQSANCVFAYFGEPDATAHEYGPFSPQVMAQVKRADQTIGYFLDKLKSKNLLSRTNLMIVSDHGMAEVKY
jgi:ectonucleotide pyrophosphatase/phosphodiesterase family protein 5